MRVAPEVAGAQTSVEADEGPGGETEVEIAAEDLAPPGAVRPGATTYVVWVRATGGRGEAEKLGVLRLDEDARGELRARTSLKRFDLFVTAEGSADPPSPSGRDVLAASVARN